MGKYILEGAGQINWMAVFALLTFLFVFLTAVVMVFRKNDAHIRHMENLPLEDNQSAQ